MRTVETVDVAELGPPCSLLAGLREWRGFAEVCPVSEARPCEQWLQLSNQPDAVWEWSGGLPAISLAPIGCFLLQDIEISGSGYVFAQDRFVREHSHTSDVALKRLCEHYPGNPLDAASARRVTIDEPVLVVTGPGHNTYGHWILDFLPRVVIAQRLLGPVLDGMPILLPSGTPSWVPRMLQAYCNIAPDRLHMFSEQEDRVTCKYACLPSFGHDGSYSLHNLVREFYGDLGDACLAVPKRRVCLSRRSFSEGRVFVARESLERMAVARGYDIVRPEELSFTEQAAMYRSANCIIGEGGSGLHGSVFAEPGTIVASVGFNWVQAHVSGAFEQKLIYMNRLEDAPQTEDGIRNFSATDPDLTSLFEVIDQLQAGRSGVMLPREP
ncbi:glycosyltransferase family 61 protein [Lichenicoccus sp.]|uniref:glycosyltransferase family 61 protein n=1 Tax=Lichenicoccus sp. TaxID=2781899 RepID=UPI003D0DB785